MKASELLIAQHDEVKTMFNQLEHGNGQSTAILKKLADSLAAHMVIEQELFYPAILEVNEDLILESYEEHAVARFSLKRLMKTSPQDREFKARVTTLRELIVAHVKEEEEDLFPVAEDALGDRSEQLCEDMKWLFETEMKKGYERLVQRGGSAVTSAHAPTHP